MQRRAAGDPQGAGLEGLVFLEQFDGFVFHLELAAGDFQQAQAEFGGEDGAFVAVKKLDLEAPFELAHVIGKGGLGETEFIRRLGETTVCGDGVEGPELR